MLSRHHPGRGPDRNLHTQYVVASVPVIVLMFGSTCAARIGRSYLYGDYHVGIGLDLVALVAGLWHYHGGYLYNWGLK